MGGNYKDKSKKKIKRKKGKKFVYRNPTEIANQDEKKNPFEDMSKQKYMKQGKQYQGLIKEYQTRFNTNSFVDRRIGEHSKNLSYDEKMKLRFKAQQMLKMNSRKNKFSLLNEDNEDEDLLTHKGKILNDEEYSDVEKSEDEDYYEKMDNYMEEVDNNKGKLSRKEIIQNIINKSKLLKEERQRLKQDTKDKIEMLDGNFAEISGLLTKRGRTFSKFNDDYDRFASQFVHSKKTHPTDRLKTDQEIEIEKEIKAEKINKQKIREEMEKGDEEEEEEHDKNNEIENMDKKKLTKRERIEKLINDRLSKGGKIVKEDIISKKRKGSDEDEDEKNEEDALSDLDEFEQNNNEDEEGDYDEDGEDDDEIGEDDLEGLEDLMGEDDMEDFEEEEVIMPKKKRKFK